MTTSSFDATPVLSLLPSFYLSKNNEFHDCAKRLLLPLPKVHGDKRPSNDRPRERTTRMTVENERVARPLMRVCMLSPWQKVNTIIVLGGGELVIRLTACRSASPRPLHPACLYPQSEAITSSSAPSLPDQISAVGGYRVSVVMM